jgi:MFS superfamily sulfate permease-like transporter
MKKNKQHYFSNLGHDLPSALVVFLVALPLCLGIALASEAPPFAGIIAGVVGGIVIGALSGSQLSVSGPAAGLTTIVAAAILKLQVFEAFLLAVVLAGFFQILFGFLKAGVVGDYIPGSVIKGMLAAIGIILIFKQLPHLVGYDQDFEGNEAFTNAEGNSLTTLSASFQAFLPAAALIGIVSILILMVWDKYLVPKLGFLQYIPAPLIAVLAGVGINEGLYQSGSALTLQTSHLVNLPIATSASGFFSFFTAPDFSYLSSFEIWKVALTLAIVASLESLLNVEASDELDPYQRVTPTNRELKAQGVGNMISGLLGGLPITSVIVRTSANINAGAKTKMSAVFHGVFLLLSVALIPGLLNKIPLSALAGILVFTGFKLAKPSLFIGYYKKGWNQFLPFIVTVVAIYFTDLLMGILIGIAVGLFFVLRTNFRSAVQVVAKEGYYLVRLRKDVSFLNKPIIKNALENIPDGSYAIIDIAKAEFIDPDVVDIIEDFFLHAPLKNIEVELKKNPGKTQGFSEEMLETEAIMAKKRAAAMN